MDLTKVIKELQAGNHRPVFFLQGSEYFLARQFFDNLYASFPDSEALDRVSLDFEDVSLQEVLEEANTFSFFSDTRLIVVEKSDFVTSQASHKLSKSDEKSLLSYLEEPNPATVLVFVCKEDQVDKRRKIVKAMQKEACWVDVTPLDQSAVDRYVRQRLKIAGLQLDEEAIEELLERVNYQLTLAMGELTKLQTFQESGKSINRHIIRELVPRTLESDVFELSNAVVNKQIDQAIQIYQDLILMKHDPIALHALLVSQFRIIIQVRIMMKEGANSHTIATHLGVHPYRVKLAGQNAQGMPLEELCRFYQELVKVDFQMKTGIGHKESYFYILLTMLHQEV